MTDGQTDRILIARLRLHCMQRGKKLAESLDVHFRIFGAKGGNRIMIKFCIVVRVPDVITHTSLSDDRFRGF